MIANHNRKSRNKFFDYFVRVKSSFNIVFPLTDLLVKFLYWSDSVT